MRQLIARLREKIAAEERILLENKESVNSRNLHVLQMVAVGCMVVFGANFLLSVFSQNVSSAGYLSFQMAYLLIIILFGAVYLMIRYFPKLNSIQCIYTIYLGADIYCILTSAFAAPNYVSVTILAMLFQIPILYVDKSWRINLFVILCAAAYMLGIAPFKNPALLVDECINASMFTIVSIIIGSFTRESQIENIGMKARLHDYAYTDSLTRLANRRSLFEDFADHSGADRISGLAIIDIDDFKRFNDTYGHQAGDACLCAVADCFLESQAQGRVRFYRYGGEEFLAVFRACFQPEMLERLTQIRERIEGCGISHSGSRLGKVTVSIGFASWEETVGENCEAMLFRADSALYEAKSKGKNRVEVYAAAPEGI